jgi:hypothetical protein
MNIPDLIFEFLGLKILKLFYADLDPKSGGSGILSTLDLGSGMGKIGSRILDPG